MIFDLIVVGCGSVGSAASYYATKAGLKVLAIDNGTPPHDHGSHHGETRLIRHAYAEGEKYVPMVLRAQQLWYELETLSGEQIMHRCGVLIIAPENSEYIRSVKESANQHKLPLEALTPEDCMQRWPQINVPENYDCVFETNSGYLESEVAIRNYIRLAKEAGCLQLFNCRVRGVTRDGDLQKVATEHGNYHGRKVLFSAGTWIKKLLPELPVTPTRKVFAWYQADDRYHESNKFPGFLIEADDIDMFYGFPANNNVLKFGGHTTGQSINNPHERKPYGEIADDANSSVDVLRRFLPGIGECIYGKSCTISLTSDDDFIIDTQPDEPNRLIIAGLSGHGFKFASVLGEIACAFAQGKLSPYVLTPFSLSRFNARNSHFHN